ncbi:MAG: Xaa-Pro peptidase family protein [Acidobacteriota bacterium]
MAKQEWSRRTFLGSTAASAAWMFSGCNQGPGSDAAQGDNPVGVDRLSPAFREAEYKDRQRRVRERMAQDNIDLLWVMLPEGMCYLHGLQMNWYQGNSPKAWGARSGTAIHIDHDEPMHFEEADHVGSLEATSVSKDNRFFRGDQLEFIISELKASGWFGGTVGLEYWSYRPNRAISQMFEEAFRKAGCNVVDASDVMRDVRLVKSPAEVAVMQEAARICDIGHRAIEETLRPGVTELEMYGEAMRAMYAAGGETPGLIQAFRKGMIEGKMGLGSHAVPSRQILRQGDSFFVDLCGVVHRYHSNTSRTYFLGEPPREVAERYEKNAGSFEVLRETARHGTPIVDVNRALVQYYEEQGLWERSKWCGGYELGIAFPPDWVGEFTFYAGDESAEGTFQANMVTNYESTLGVLVIDTLLYQEGKALRLSSLPHEIVVVG